MPWTIFHLVLGGRSWTGRGPGFRPPSLAWGAVTQQTFGGLLSGRPLGKHWDAKG